jgi:hypothetical protein
VCPLLHKFSDNYSENNGVFQGYKGYQSISGQSSGHVSLFYQPTRHESGSYVQISNLFYFHNNSEGNSLKIYNDNDYHNDFYNIFKPSYHAQKAHTHERFKHGLGSIRAILAELEVFQNYEGYQGYKGMKHAAEATHAPEVSHAHGLKGYQGYHAPHAKDKGATNGVNSFFFILPLDESFPYIPYINGKGNSIFFQHFNSFKTSKQALWVFRLDLFNPCQTGLMGVLTTQVLF